MRFLSRRHVAALFATLISTSIFLMLIELDPLSFTSALFREFGAMGVERMQPLALNRNSLGHSKDSVGSASLLSPGITHPDVDFDTAPLSHNDTLGIASKTYVISLPHRMDRRATMERLRQTLSLQWTYVDAVRSDSLAVRHIIQRVQMFRQASSTEFKGHLLGEQFDWPADIDMLSRSRLLLDIPQADNWSTSSEDSSPVYLDVNDPLLSDEGSGMGEFRTPDDLLALGSSPDPTEFPVSGPALSRLTCATKSFVAGPPSSPSLPSYMILTPAKIACWHSHLQVIQHIANGIAYTSAAQMDDTQVRGEEIAIILEDDVDMESDIRERLQRVWSALPPDWDIVFLGHCWSNESYYPAIAQISSMQDELRTTLHPSFAPKCTHAYALSRTGARRLLLHLRHPPFAYSRALDQALSWLVMSGRLKAFSVVPSLVVQRKLLGSDIDSGGNGMGSAWREHLADGVLGG